MANYQLDAPPGSPFPRKARLTSKREITAVLRRPKKRIDREGVRVLAAPNERGYARLGVVVGRSYDRRSTRRNQFKRCVRESFRLARRSLSGVDVLVLARGRIGSENLKRELKGAFRQLEAEPHAPAGIGAEKPSGKRQPLRLRIVLKSIDLYRLALSPLLGARCRFYPTCSSYAKQAIQQWGIAKGLALTLRRLAKCQPFHPGGYDPVPSSLTD